MLGAQVQDTGGAARVPLLGMLQIGMNPALTTASASAVFGVGSGAGVGGTKALMRLLSPFSPVFLDPQSKPWQAGSSTGLLEASICLEALERHWG
jgi:hypothetical protein